MATSSWSSVRHAPAVVRASRDRNNPKVLDAYLSELVRRLRAQLGEQLLAVWAVGSAAFGDFDPALSDLDVQAVSVADLSRMQLAQIAAELSQASLPCPARGLEFVLYARAGLADSHGPAFQLNLNTGRALEPHVGYDPNGEPRFWFVLDVAIARQRARRLAGADPRQILPELPRALVLSALLDALAWWREHDGAQAVLSACRAWAWHSDGQWRSKQQAATWAAEHSPEHASIITAALEGARTAHGPTLSMQTQRPMSAPSKICSKHRADQR